MSASARPSEAPPPAPASAPPRRRRWWVKLLGLVLVLLLLPPLAIGGALLWANTEGGRATIARLAGSLVPGLTLEGLEGPLPGRIGLRRLTLADEAGPWLEVEGARLAWDPLALLRGEARVTLLAAERVALHRLPPSDPNAPPSPPGPLLPELPSLPVAIALERLEVRRIEIGESLAGQAATLRATGAARLEDAGLTAELAAETPDSATLLALDATLRPAKGPLQARLRLRDAAGGLVGRLLGLPERPTELDLTWDGPAEAAALSLRAAAGPGITAELTGTLRAPDLANLGATLEGRIDPTGLLEAPLAALAGPLALRLEASRQPDGRIELPSLALSGPAGRLEAQGRVEADGQHGSLRARLALAPSTSFAALLPGELLTWQGLVLEATAEGALAAPTVDATLTTTGFGSGQAALAALLGPTPSATLRAGPVGEGLPPARIERLALTGAGVQAELSGVVGETLDLRFGARVGAVQGVAPGVSGSLRIAGTATGPMADPSLTLDADSARLEVAGEVLEALSMRARVARPASAPTVEVALSGRSQGQPLALDLRGRPAPDGALRLEAATARLGPAQLEAEGRIDLAGPFFDGKAKLTIADLAPLSPLAGGRPLGGALRLEATFTHNGTQRVAARLTTSRVVAQGTELRDLDIRIDGSLAETEFALSGKGFDVTVEARGKQTLQPDGVRRLELTAFSAAGMGESIRLAAPARLLVKPDGAIEVAALSLAGTRGATLRAEGRFGPERADLRASLALPDLATFTPFLPDIAPRGRVTGELRVTGRSAAPEIAATLRGQELRASAGTLRGLPAADLQAEGSRAADGAINARAQLSLGQATRLTATARLPRGPAGPLEGALDGQTDLAAVVGPLLAAGADRVTGRLTLALRATGTVEAPVLGGEARLTGGSYRNAVIGASLTDLAGTLRAEGQRVRADLTGRTAGDGRLALTGTIEPLGPGLPVDLALRATAAQPVSSDLVRMTLDADLQLTGAVQNGATLRGPVRLRRVDLRVPEQLPSSVRSLGPVTERGQPPGRPPRPAPPRRAPAARAAEPAAAPPAVPITLAVQLQAPQGVYVRGRGIDAELGGALDITGPVTAPEINGELRLRRGDIAILARRLAFDRGRLTFNGGLIPDLDFRATSQTGATTVHAEVTGSPTSPTITFSSTPELPQDEVLARLLFDRPVRELSPLELAQIAQALAGATGLAPDLAPGNVLDRVRRTLGLDRLAVGGGGEGASRSTAAEERRGATLEAGRYVADGVYVGVRQGTDGGARVGVRVDITPRLRLEAETGDREAGERVGVSMEWQWGR